MAVGLLVLLAASFVQEGLTNLPAWTEEVADTSDGVETSLLQISLHPPQRPEKLEPLAPLAHHWPHARGRTGELSITPYPMVMSSGNLSSALLWHKDFGSRDAVWGALIDHESNLYVACRTGIWKMSPTGEVLWRHPDRSAMYSVLVGNAVCSQTNINGRSIYCLSQKTGEEFWHRKVFPTAGFGGNQIEAHNGVIMVAAGEFTIEMLTDMTGKANDRVVAVNASTGDELWQFKADCGLWMFMGLFPDNDTTLFQDQCGGIYRLGLFNGSLLWYTPGNPDTLSDGAAILGPDGSVYGCSMPPGAKLLDNNDPLYPGVLRKLRLSDGKVLWSVETPYPCTNIPAVTPDGRTLVVAPGAIPAVDGPYYYMRKHIHGLPKDRQLALRENYDRMMRNNTLRAHFNMTDLTGAIMGFDTRTGNVQWRHEVPPSGAIQAAGDDERNWVTFIEGGLEDADVSAFDSVDQTLPHCGPPHWTAPLLDQQGNIYIGDSVGEVRVYNPKTDKEIDFHTGDGFLPGGPSAAPGIIVFATCQTLYVFKAEGTESVN